MDSLVPLDAHGNPLSDEDGDMEDGSLLGSGHETAPLVLSSTEQFDRVSLLIRQAPFSTWELLYARMGLTILKRLT